MKRIVVVVSFFLIVLSTNSCFAWGKVGHSLVAEVAFANLDAKTKTNVLLYLDGMTIEEAANWMDAIRSNKSYDYMKPYHYVDFDRGASVTELSGDNIINVLQKTLKDLDAMNQLTNDDKRLHLLYLFHLVGDLHMPLHVGYKDDKGGNAVQVSFFGRGSNLHALWDSDIIEYKGLTLAEVLQTNTYKGGELTAVQQIDVTGWAKDSRKYLKNAYALQDAKITDLYVDANYPIIKRQILKAGLRLAAILEYYFKNDVYVASSAVSSAPKEDVTEAIVTVAIDVSKVADYDGKLVTFCSKVYSGKVLDSNGMTLLDVGAEYPEAPLTVVIYADSLKNFDFKPVAYYVGKTVCFTGTVKLYKGKPEIICNTQKDITIK